MSLVHERTRAVQQTLERVKQLGLPRVGDPTPEQIDAAQAAFRELGERTELFPPEQFPYLYESRSGFYRIGEDPDHHNALYIQVSSHRQANQPHKHPYWAIITGVQGDELNILYERIDDGSVEGKGKLSEPLPVHIEPGVSFFIHNKYFHTIHIEGEPDGVHLHFYAIATDTREHREVQRFKTPDSEEVFVREYKPEPGVIGVQRIGREDVEAALATDDPVAFLKIGAQEGGAADLLPGAAAIEPALVGTDPAILPADLSTPVVLVGEGKPVRIAAEKLTRLGYFSTFWFDPAHAQS